MGLGLPPEVGVLSNPLRLRTILLGFLPVFIISGHKNGFSVPFEQFAVRLTCAGVRDCKPRSVHGIVFFSIVELFFDSLANLNRIFRCDSQVSPVKQRVEVLPEQEAVGYGVLPTSFPCSLRVSPYSVTKTTQIWCYARQIEVYDPA
jgi:hypothetical protein